MTGLDETAPRRGLSAHITCPNGYDITFTDGDTCVLDVPDGQPPRRRVKLRVMTDTNIATVEVEPSVLMASALMFATEEAIAEIPAAIERRLRHLEADHVD